MVGPQVPLRCTTCGRLLVATAYVASSATWVSCPSCGHAVPVLHPREPPPLFSWEVYPHLYPQLPPPSRSNGAMRTFVFGLLVAATVLLAGVAAAVAFEGAVSFDSGPFEVRGNVVAVQGTGARLPISGAQIVAHGESGPAEVASSDASGAFRCSGLGPGRVSLDVSAPGYESAQAVVFVSASYSTVGTDAQPVEVALHSGTASGNTTVTSALSNAAFSDLEQFVANLWSSAILVGLGAALSSAGAVAAIRNRRPAVVAAGGASAALAPAALFLLGITMTFPVLILFAALAIGAGVLTTGLQAARMARTSDGTGDP